MHITSLQKPHVNKLRCCSIATSALKMETVCFSETLASIDEYTRRQNQEQQHHPHRRENLRSLFLALFGAVIQCVNDTEDTEVRKKRKATPIEISPA
jgi:hypothetical protein